MPRTLPEWSKDELEYVEPTQVARSFGYDVFASEYVDPETFEWNEKTLTCVAEVDGPVAGQRSDYPDPETAAQAIKNKALELGAAMVGITRVDPFHVYKGSDLTHQYGVVIAVPMEYDEMKYGATERHVREVIKIYAVAGRMAVDLARFIRARGYPARAHTLRFEQLSMLPHAHAAGLGELGKHGSLINKELGCSFRVSMVTTDLPMALDAPGDWGVEAVCSNCDMCTRWCPGDAIVPEKETVRGIERWIVEIEKCAPYWGSYYACGICLEVCPFNAKAFDGRYKQSLIERINGFDREAWNRQLEAGLQQPWQYVEPPGDQAPGWRNYVEGKGDAGVLMQGIPKEGLPEAVYETRSRMGIRPRRQD
jgi:ferredoxin